MSHGPAPTRIPIRFDAWYRTLSTIVGLPPSLSWIEVDGGQVAVRMGWAFSTRFPRSAVVSVSVPGFRPMSRGVHGFAGRWLVNGSGRGVASLELDPVQRAYVMGFPVRLRQLMVSVEAPSVLADALGKRLIP